MKAANRGGKEMRPERLPTAPAGAIPLVDEVEARRLAEAHGLPEIEVDAALFGETVEHAEGVLGWIDHEEGKLVRAHGLIEGRKRYEPLRMLKSYARKYRTGRYRSS